LKIRPVIAAFFRPFIPVKPQPFQAVQNRLECAFNLALLIGVLNADDEFAAAGYPVGLGA
jgi:hypothetical protein